MEYREQLFFWKYVKIRNRIGIKNTGGKTAFKFDLNLLGFTYVWKNLTNSPKFLFAFAFQIVNLD
jgi:hypothetical protein